MPMPLRDETLLFSIATQHLDDYRFAGGELSKLRSHAVHEYKDGSPFYVEEDLEVGGEMNNPCNRDQVVAFHRESVQPLDTFLGRSSSQGGVSE